MKNKFIFAGMKHIWFIPEILQKSLNFPVVIYADILHSKCVFFTEPIAFLSEINYI